MPVAITFDGPRLLNAHANQFKVSDLETYLDSLNINWINYLVEQIKGDKPLYWNGEYIKSSSQREVLKKVLIPILENRKMPQPLPIDDLKTLGIQRKHCRDYFESAIAHLLKTLIDEHLDEIGQGGTFGQEDPNYYDR